MDFTAKNAFGGRARHFAIGEIDDRTGKATLIEVI